jgi:hypothetical protein
VFIFWEYTSSSFFFETLNRQRSARLEVLCKIFVQHHTSEGFFSKPKFFRFAGLQNLNALVNKKTRHKLSFNLECHYFLMKKISTGDKASTQNCINTILYHNKSVSC